MSKKEETTDEEKQKQIATIIEALKRQNITPAPGSAAALAAAGIGSGSDPTKSAQESEQFFIFQKLNFDETSQKNDSHSIQDCLGRIMAFWNETPANQMH